MPNYRINEIATTGINYYLTYPVAADAVISVGDLVNINATGYAVRGDDTATDAYCVGVATEDVDNTDGSNGDMVITVRCGLHKIKYDTTVTPTVPGTAVYVSTTHTVTSAGDATNDVPAGYCVSVHDGDSDTYIYALIGMQFALSVS